MLFDRRAVAHRRLLLLLACASALLGLSGCFDLTQRVVIRRGGDGIYAVAISAHGRVGQVLKSNPVTLDHHAKVTVGEKDGQVTEVSAVAFRSLSDLRLSSEAISLRVLERTFFGLGPTHVRFRRTFLVNHARRNNASRFGADGEMGSQIMATVFGDHTYAFSVTVPGSILRIAPVKVDNAVVMPTVTGDFFHGHTITWTMPLYSALDVQMMTFEVDFSAYGTFTDVQSRVTDADSL